MGMEIVVGTSQWYCTKYKDNHDSWGPGSIMVTMGTKYGNYMYVVVGDCG